MANIDEADQAHFVFGKIILVESIAEGYCSGLVHQLEAVQSTDFCCIEDGSAFGVVTEQRNGDHTVRNLCESRKKK